MLGAIAGDIIGSAFESEPVKHTGFKLFSERSRFTDDTVLTVATAYAILRKESYMKAYKAFGRRYPDRGYGNNFHLWMNTDDVAPYNSWGNGSAMRVSPVGHVYDSVEEVLREAARSAEVTHNHPEGVKGAQAAALAVLLARTGASKTKIRNEITTRFGYNLDRELYDIRQKYSFDISCQGSVPESIIAFLESDSWEDAVRNAVSLGGDSDTMACIAGSIAEAYYRHIPPEIVTAARKALPAELLKIVDEFDGKHPLPAREQKRSLRERAQALMPSVLAPAHNRIAAPAPKRSTGYWDPYVRADDLTEESRRIRFSTAAAAKRGEWDRFLAPFQEKKPGEFPLAPNLIVPDGRLLPAPLHLAAQCGAPLEVVQELTDLGAWRTLQNARGERPVDVAARCGHDYLLKALEPEYRMRIPWGLLRQIEHELHEMMRDYLERQFKSRPLKTYSLRLPQVEPALESAIDAIYMDIPATYGTSTFNFSFNSGAAQAMLVVFGVCRVSGGSEEKYEITQAGRRRVAWR